VLSSVHTNDAASAVTRLIDLGLEPFMVASSLVGVVSMRLVRTLCPRCKESYEVPASNLNRLGVHEVTEGTVTLSRGRGCPHCRETGYFGRIGIFEVLEVNDAVRTLIAQNAPDSAIRLAAIETGMRSIGEDGLKKVMDGRTTLEEVTRVVYLSEHGVKMCAHCSSVLSKEFEYCPSCGEFVGEHCESCRRRLNPTWTFCPFCGVDTPAAPDSAASEDKVADDGARGPRVVVAEGANGRSRRARRTGRSRPGEAPGALRKAS
jgi:predicted RNA-binding Zn-ribbon protein involved in translation (DUF1610 family)